MESMQNAMTTVQQTKRQHERELIRKPNVVAVGVGYKISGGVQTDEPSVIVSVKQKMPLAR
jgi:hypothetical protein